MDNRLIGVVFFFAVALFSLPATAKETEILESLQAETLWYEERENRLYATGKVVYADGDYKLTANSLSYSLDSKLVQAKGEVFLTIGEFNAKGEKAVLRTENLTFNQESKQLHADKVSLTVAGDTITGDILEYDKAAGRLTVQGNVRIKRKQENAVFGQLLLYDTKLDEGKVTDYRQVIERDGVKYYAAGKTLTYNDEKTVTDQAVVTTCDEPQPHYVFRIRKAENYPEKKLVLWDSEYWQEQKKLFTTKKTVVAIHDGELVLPTTGVNDNEGWYFKFREYYELAGKDYGVIYTDYMSYRGFGLGFREYRYGKAGELNDEYSLYASRKPFITNQVVQGEWKTHSGGVNQTFSFRNEENGWQQTGDTMSANWLLLGTGGNARTSAEGSFYRQLGSATFMGGQVGQIIDNSKDFRTYWDYNFSRSLGISGYKYTDRNFNGKFEWTDPQHVTSLSATEALRGYDYAPKLTYYTTFESPWQYAVSTARVTNPAGDVTLQQTDFKTFFRSKTQKIGQGTFLSTTSTIERTAYGSSQATNFAVNSSVLKNVNEKTYINTALSFGRNRGWNPLTKTTTDNDSRQLDVETDYAFDDYHRINLTLGYDFVFSKYRPALLNLEGRAYPFWSWNLYSEYEIKDKRWQTAGVMLTFNPTSGITGYVRAEFNLPDNMLNEASVRLEGGINEKWTYSVKTDYYAGDQLNISEIKFVKDNHCQDLIISYYPRRRMIFAEISLKNPEHK